MKERERKDKHSGSEPSFIDCSVCKSVQMLLPLSAAELLITAFSGLL